MPAMFAERAESWPSFTQASRKTPEVSLITVASHEGDGGSELLTSIVCGLTHPTVPLSAQAAAKLRETSSSPRHAPGDLVKSLPVELLYDDNGLQLFDQVREAAAVLLTQSAS